jgi:hypothetical protein
MTEEGDHVGYMFSSYLMVWYIKRGKVEKFTSN